MRGYPAKNMQGSGLKNHRLTGFHPLLQVGLTTFTDVVGVNGIRLNQTLEKVEGLGAMMLNEYDIAEGEPLLVITATGTTQ